MTGAALLLVVVGVLAAAPAQADPGGGAYDSWISREDATTPGSGTTYSWSGPDDGLHLSTFSGQLAAYTGDQEFGANFVPPAGQTLRAGVT